jgi:cytochrome c5
MSEHDPHEHSSFIKTPQQLIAVIVLAFVVPVIVISIIASLALRSVEPSAIAFSEKAIAERLKPVGEVVVAAEGGTAAPRTGQQIVEAVCSACHATGALNAPRIGDTAAWGPLIKHGFQQLVENAIKGIRQMPPRGGNPELSDFEVARAVAYMVNQSGGKFSEPEPPAPVAGETKTPVSGAAPATAASAASAPPASVAAAAPAKPAAGGAAEGGKGKAVYESACVACHGAGVAGAPKLGDKAAWAPRIKQGMDVLYQSSLKGKGAMPPKGGQMQLSDADVKAAVEFMVSQSK